MTLNGQARMTGAKVKPLRMGPKTATATKCCNCGDAERRASKKNRHKGKGSEVCTHSHRNEYCKPYCRPGDDARHRYTDILRRYA
jgi:hypothetical protein